MKLTCHVHKATKNYYATVSFLPSPRRLLYKIYLSYLNNDYNISLVRLELTVISNITHTDDPWSKKAQSEKH